MFRWYAASAVSDRVLRMYVIDPRPSFSRSMLSNSGSSPLTVSGSLMTGLKYRLFSERISTA